MWCANVSNYVAVVFADWLWGERKGKEKKGEVETPPKRPSQSLETLVGIHTMCKLTIHTESSVGDGRATGRTGI